MNWHESLMGFGAADNSMDVEDDDAKLLSKLVEKVVIPRLIARIDIYDPYSTKQTKIAIRLVSQMLNYTETDSKPFKVGFIFAWFSLMLIFPNSSLLLGVNCCRRRTSRGSYI